MLNNQLVGTSWKNDVLGAGGVGPPKAVHDIFLSPAPVRESAYREMERWLGGYLRYRD